MHSEKISFWENFLMQNRQYVELQSKIVDFLLFDLVMDSYIFELVD